MSKRSIINVTSSSNPDKNNNNTNNLKKLKYNNENNNTSRNQTKEQPPIKFFLYEIHYVPALVGEHHLYFVGRTEDVEGVCAITTCEHEFYLERRTPFRNETDAGHFLTAIQNQIDKLTTVKLQDNPYWEFSIEKKNNDGNPFDKIEEPVAKTSKLGFPSKYGGFGTEQQKEWQRESWKSVLPGYNKKSIVFVNRQ